MSEPEKSDKWNSLLETLGVAASETSPKPPEAAADSPKPAPAPPRSAKPAPKPKAAPPAAKSPSYWSRIAGALGLDVAPEPEPLPPSPAAEVPSLVQEQPARAPEPRPKPRETPPRQPLESMFGPKEPDVDVFGLDRREAPPAHREPTPAHREPTAARREPPRRAEAPPPPSSSLRDAEDDEGFVLDYEVEGDSDLNLGEAPPAAPDDLDEEEGPPRRGFGEGQPRGEREGGEREGEERGGRRRRGRRRGRGRGGRREEGQPQSSAQTPPPPRYEPDLDDESDLFGPPTEAEFELDDASDLDLGPEISPAALDDQDDLLPPRRPQRDEQDERRPRRGRRGGRGRDRDREPAGQRPPSPARAPRDERRPAAVSGEEGEFDLIEEHEPDEGASSGHPTHKKIPTWDEAVGILIEANMAARADRPDRDRGRGNGGGGGGRGRGGRGRGGRR